MVLEFKLLFVANKLPTVQKHTIKAVDSCLIDFFISFMVLIVLSYNAKVKQKPHGIIAVRLKDYFSKAQFIFP